MRNSPSYKSLSPSVRKIRVLLYTRYKLVQESLETLLEKSGEFSVINAPPAIKELSGAARKNPFDLLVLGLINNNEDNIEIIPEIHNVAPEARIFVLTSTDDIKIQYQAAQLGAVGVMQFEQGKDSFLRALKQIHEGETWFNQKLITQILNKGVSKGNVNTKDWEVLKLESLTIREREVINLICLAMSNKAIAKKLCISEATVRHHLSSIYSKLGMEDRLNLVIYAYQHKLFKPFPDQTGEATHTTSKS
jgi:two-component system, NarL family, response regulator DegU